MAELKSKVIENPEVANIAAYAAYPHEDTAHTLEKHGFDDLAEEQRAKVDTASVAALEEWIRVAKNKEYLDGGDPDETDRRRTEFGMAAHSFSAETPVAEGGEAKDSPEFKGVGPEFAARVVGYMLTRDPDTPVSMVRIAEELGGENQSKVSKVITQLTDMGYVTREKQLDHGHRPFKSLTPTDKMLADAAEIPAWHDQVELFELARQFGMSDTETRRYLVKLGKAMFLHKKNSVE
jgi:DNA-binding MarR family transcriptional regulator